MVNWANFISQCFNGLVTGALLALISSGLTIIYGTLGVLNLAHGALFMLGGYAGWLAYQYSDSFIIAVVAGSLFVMLVGFVVERVIIVRGKAKKDMKSSDDYWDVLEVVPGEGLMQAPDAFGCKLGSYT